MVFDVGANYGLFSIFVGQRGPKKLTVHAFEPVPPVADYCQANIDLHMKNTNKDITVRWMRGIGGLAAAAAFLLLYGPCI